MTLPGPICSETDITLLYKPLTVHKKRMAFIFHDIQHALRSNTNRNSKNAANKQQKFHDHKCSNPRNTGKPLLPFLVPCVPAIENHENSINLRLSGPGDIKYTSMKFYNTKRHQTLNYISDMDYSCCKGQSMNFRDYCWQLVGQSKRWIHTIF